jgi:cytochrome c oxidase subunit 2
MNKILDSIGRFFSELFASGSAEAYDINSLFFKFIVIAGFIALLVAFLVIVGAIRYRSSRRPGEPRQISGNNTLEILWTVIPLALLSIFFVFTIETMRQINQPFNRNQKPDIRIIAHQWWWDMRYPQYNVITANELHIPVGKKLLMSIESVDVIHDWWVPELGRKIDAVPGHINYTWIDADTAGVYEGTCSEYCGMQHAWMRIKVIAQPETAFRQWIKHQKQIPGLPADSLALAGSKIFQQKTCANCHYIAGTPADSHIGPDLTHLRTRRTILSVMMKNTPENLTSWLKDPQTVKKGAHMPNFRLSQNEIKALVAYLEGLK